MDKRYIFFMISVLILAALACNAGSIADQETTSTEVELEAPSGESPAPEGQAPEQDAPEEQSAEEQTTEDQTTEEQVPVGTGEDQTTCRPAASPIGLREGLASFNSFRMTMNTINNGPTPMDRNESRIEIKYDTENDSRHMHTETLSSSAEYPEEERSVEDEYQVDLITCTISVDGDYTDASTEELTPVERDMAESTSNLFDMIITAENPTLVGQETLNGIPSNHYTFKVTGLGDYSGSEVKLADGEYWVALDGQYLVKYTLLLEVATGQEGDPATEVMYSEYSFELMETNQPLNISMPPECTS